MIEPITVSYKVELLSSGRTVSVKVRRMFRWEREDRKLYIQKSVGLLGRTAKMEMATCFAEEMSQGLLYDRVDLISSLTELLKIGFLVDFEGGEVEFLLRSKNLQLFPEDVDFLLDAFPARGLEVLGQISSVYFIFQFTDSFLSDNANHSLYFQDDLCC
jgi:sacsin